MTEDQFRAEVMRRFDEMDAKLDNVASQVGELSVEVGAINTRLTNVEKAVNQIASRVGIPSIPAIGGGQLAAG